MDTFMFIVTLGTIIGVILLAGGALMFVQQTFPNIPVGNSQQHSVAEYSAAFSAGGVAGVFAFLVLMFLLFIMSQTTGSIALQTFAFAGRNAAYVLLLIMFLALVWFMLNK